MKITFENVSSLEGIRNLDLELDLSHVTVLYDPSEILSHAILNAIVGLDELRDGQILVDGIPHWQYLDQEPQARSFGYVFDEGIMLSNLSLKENLMLPLRWLNPDLDEGETQKMIDSWMQRFDLNLDLSQRPVVYRPGELKLLSFVRTLMIAPKALLIDDPYYMLNKTERQKLYRILCNLKNSNPMLIASIDDDFGSGFADEIIDLSGKQGNLVSVASLS